MKKYIIEKVAVSALADAWGRVNGNKRVLLCTMLFDLLFLISAFAYNKFLDLVSPGMFGFIQPSVWYLLKSGLQFLAALAVLLLIYSFFKQIVMCRLRSMFTKSRVSMKGFWSFYLMNLRLVGIFLLVFAFIGAIFSFSIEMPVLPVIGTVLLSLLGLLLYLSMNTAHSLFFQEGKSNVVMRSLSLVFNRFRAYISIIVFTTVAFFLLAGGYYLLDWAVLRFIGDAITTPAVYLGYAAFNTIILFTLGFGLLAFNRVYFYCIVEKGKRFIMDKG